MDDLPRDLPQTFERILSKFVEDDVDIGRRMFTWIAVARRPLTIEEMRVAIAVKPFQETWDSKSLVNDMRRAMACCGNLVHIEDESQTIHFMHGSVKQYLCERRTDGAYHIDLEETEENAAAVCVTYLNLPIFKKQIARRTDMSTSAIPSIVIKNSLPGTSANKLALRLLRRQERSSNSLQTHLEDIRNEIDHRPVAEEHSFHAYAQEFWLKHTSRIKYSHKLYHLANSLLEDLSRKDIFTATPWTFEDWNKRHRDVAQWIHDHEHILLAWSFISVQNGCEALFRIADMCESTSLIETCVVSTLLPRAALRRAVLHAAASDRLELLEKLIERGAPFDQRDGLGRTPFHIAAQKGHLPIVDRFLREKIDVDLRTTLYGETALHLAVAGNHRQVVDRLLCADANVNLGDHTGQTALHYAAYNGQINILDMLCLKGADVNLGDDNGRTALHYAARNGHTNIIDMLCLKGVDVNLGDHTGQTALHEAAKYGQTNILDVLCLKGANVNLTDDDDNTALHLAAEWGVLFPKLYSSINVRAKNENGKTPYQIAMDCGHKDLAEEMEKFATGLWKPSNMFPPNLQHRRETSPRRLR